MEKNKWTIIGAGIQVSVQLVNGKLSWQINSDYPEMNIEYGDLGALNLQGCALQWTKIIEVKEESVSEGKRLSLTVESEDAALQLTRMIQVFSDRPFVRTWGRVKNIGSMLNTIDQCEILDFLMANKGHYSLFHVEQVSAHYRRDFFSQNEAWLLPGRAPHEIRMGSFPSQYWGPTSCAWFALRKGQWGEALSEGDGLVCGIEFNGKSRLFAGATDRQTQLVSKIERLAHRLSPGAVFEIPAYFIGFFHGDWDEAGYVTQRFAEAHIHPPMPDDRYPWAQYNSWAFGQDINERQQLAAIDRCAELGIELIVLDLGWARMVGDWRPDPIKFPNGLKPLAERAKLYGMRFGVHVALAQCNIEAPIAKEHPEWLTHREVDYFGAAPLCLGHEPCRTWLIAQLTRLIDEENIDYIVQDGEDMVKQCDHTDHTHAPEDSNYANSQYGLDLVIQSLQKARPNLVLENCEDGGCMMTYKMASMYHTSITVDNIDAYSTRQGVYGASFVFSPRYSVRYMQDAPTKYSLYSSLFGGPLIFMHRVTDWSEQEVEETREAISLYKALRGIVRDAKIIHLAAPKYNDVGGGWGWDAIQAVTQDKRQSIVMVYRAIGDAAEKRIQPRGLVEDAVYTVALIDQKSTQTMTGAELMDKGINIALTEYDAEIIQIVQTQ